ncbi:MAG: hypothetical protein HOQ18_16870 [Dermatophilaceae bacterium]|nr:hypothetical protein [Dermatophilaceae bacterium]
MMLVDCQTCPVRDVHCADCMVTALTETPLRLGTRTGGTGFADLAGAVAPAPTPDTAPLDRAERRAVSAFLSAGLVTTATANAARAQLDRAEGAPTQATGTRWAV